jgi:hypothetical protein
MQVNSLMTIEAKKKYEFLESISAIMDSHFKYFKLVCFFSYFAFRDVTKCDQLRETSVPRCTP